jgi:hypothetical protein
MSAAELMLLEEPPLEFRYGQTLADPHSGLGLIGPYDADLPSHPQGLVYGVIGHSTGVEAFKQWCKRIPNPLLHEDMSLTETSDLTEAEKRKADLLWPPYPGFESAFSATWPKQPAWVHELDGTKLVELATHKDPNQRAFGVVNCYQNAMEAAHKRDEGFGVIICVVPDIVWQNCRPLSRVKDGHGHTPSQKERKVRRSQTSLFEEYDPVSYEMSVDFRRQLKARSMEFGTPIQLVRESTLRLRAAADGERQLTPPPDRAWNLTTTMYYKAGGKPWRLATAREGVCYIGLAFRRSEDKDDPRTACCAAQMFLDTGDGIVFKGEFGPWYSPESRECHLDMTGAKELLAGALKTYSDEGGKPLTEIFLHSRSSIDDAEFNGYQQAVPSGVKLVGVRVRTDARVKLFRQAKWPVMRGTFWRLSERSGYLWASGFKPQLLSYDGWEVPNPLRIDIQHGDADIVQVAKDILGLTKLNYNTCKLGDSLPVTVGFSDAVGEILISNPTVKKARPNFKFYI